MKDNLNSKIKGFICNICKKEIVLGTCGDNHIEKGHHDFQEIFRDNSTALIEDTKRMNFINELAKKRGLDFKRILEILLDAQVSLKEVIKTFKLAGIDYIIKRKGLGPIITSYGKFYQSVFEINDRWQRYFVITKSDLNRDTMIPSFDLDKEVYVRIDSGCHTGQLFGDKTCECKEQLEISLNTLGKSSQGIVIYIPNQDGRGKGTEFKLATLYLQEQLGIDTTESFSLLERDNSNKSMDERDYLGAVGILRFLGISKSILLGTNNPEKINTLIKEGFSVKPEPIIAELTKLTKNHIIAKKEVLGHFLNVIL